MFDPAAIQSIPGMIEPVEQRTLYGLAAQLSLNPGDQMVEFGSFFGRSTACLAEGLADNPNRTESNRLHAYDSFGCAAEGGFSVHVKAFAESGGVSHLLKSKDGRMDFFPVFQHYLSAHLQKGLVIPVCSELRDSVPRDIDQIVLMHIDSPKFYQELRFLIEHFFPRLSDGAIVVFQDYFYHWSATLIAAVEAMRELGLLEYRMSAASALVVQLEKHIDANTVFELDRQLADSDKVHSLIRQAIEFCNRIQLDRPEVFVPRLWLAAYQHLWESGLTVQATELIGSFFADGGKLLQPVLNDYLEMMRAGFTNRVVYELDHA